jgi:hypothetical protein
VPGIFSIRLLVAAGLCFSLTADDSTNGGCSFTAEPDRFLAAESRARRALADRVSKARAASALRTVDPASLPRRNFIDDEIFGALSAAGVKAAPLSSDEEFFRRINLDLTGRIPAPAEIRDFIADTSPGKRERLINKLLDSSEFVDKWTMWIGDWLRNSATNSLSNSPQQLAGRNAFYKYIWLSVAGGKSLRDVAIESISSYGNNYDEATGNANFISSTSTPGGPIQDTWDTMLVKSATAFLGLGSYDCLLCHSGRGHLDTLNLWGKNTTRIEAQKMAAFFSRTNLVRWTAPAGTPQAEINANFYNNSYRVDDVANRNYTLNTNYGNRPNRAAQNGLSQLTPEYRDTLAKPAANENWRFAFANSMVDDPMFARNVVNRVWKQLFSLGLVDPVDQLDPARLDPGNPPPAPWTFQATHPVLMEKLAKEFARQWFDLRGIVRFLVESTAYQLSSQYTDEWNVALVPLFPRHYPRRLDGEEVHDAVAKATGIFPRYTQFNWGEQVQWAMQLLDSVEPRSNGAAANFMNNFLRGNRDTTQRSQASSLQQQLALMNDAFVLPKLKMAASPMLKEFAKLPNNEALVEEMFLTFISRMPTDHERTRALFYLNRAATTAQKNAAIEDLAWVLVNKVDFLYSY